MAMISVETRHLLDARLIDAEPGTWPRARSRVLQRLAAWLLCLSRYGFAVAITCLALAIIMQLWRADLAVPFDNRGDALPITLWIKTIAKHPWYFVNRDVGLPTGLDMRDYPLGDSLHFLLIKLMCLAIPNHILVMNLYFLLGFPLASATSLFVMRQLGLAYGPALVSSQLFAFLPYHFFRGIAHLFLASYYLVPLIVLMALWIDEGTMHWRSSRFAACLVIAAIASCASVYYTFFACYLLAVAGLGGSLGRACPRPFLSAMALIAVMTSGAIANFVPTYFYQLRHGTNADALRRFPAEAEAYGLKLAPLLLPVPQHRIDALAQLTNRYHHPLGVPLLHNENLFGPLGVIGGIGFLYLTLRLLATRKTRTQSMAPDRLARFNALMLLLGTTGGFGAIIAIIGFDSIRCYNRVSVYLAFFSLAAVAHLLDAAGIRLAERWRGRAVDAALLGCVLVIGLFDQTTNSFVPAYQRMAETEAQYSRFVSKIEAAVPAETAIFQLPYVNFLEHAPPGTMDRYEHLQPYLHSRTLRWSYGAMPGRRADYFQKAAAGQAPQAMLRALALGGFGGIWLDRAGYQDRAAALAGELKSLLDQPPVESANGRWLFYNLAGFNERLRKTYTLARWNAERDCVLYPIVPMWSGGFSAAEGSAGASGRACSAHGTLQIDNDMPRARRCRIAFTCATWHPQPAKLTLDSRTAYTIDSTPRVLSQVLTLTPGLNSIALDCDAKPADAPWDPRTLVFRVSDLSITDMDQ